VPNFEIASSSSATILFVQAPVSKPSEQSVVHSAGICAPSSSRHPTSPSNGPPWKLLSPTLGISHTLRVPLCDVVLLCSSRYTSAVTSLILPGNSLTDGCAFLIAEVITRRTTVSHLDLSRNQISTYAKPGRGVAAHEWSYIYLR